MDAAPAIDPASLGRIAQAVIAAEVSRLRGAGSRPLPPLPWPDAMPLGDEGLGLDSLEMLGVPAALAETFDLDASTQIDRPPERVGDLLSWIAAAWTADTLAVFTSGSTGPRKACVHRVSDLLAETAAFAAMLPGRRRVVALVPAHHLYGLIWTALLPAALGVPVVERTLGARLDLAPGDLVVAVPEQWRSLARLCRVWPADLWGVSSGGPLPGDVEEALAGSGPARMLDVYGASELGGIAVRTLPEADYRLMERWRLAEDGAALMDAGGHRHPLPDHLVRTGEGRVRPAGRRDHAIQIGGHNVWPERVAALLRETAGVAEAAVRPGAAGRLKAFVVPVAGADRAALDEALRMRIATLADPERPTALAFGPALPRNAMGKLADWH